MKIFLIIAISCGWIYVIMLIIYTCLEAFYVWHPDKYQASVLWRIERREKRQQRYRHSRQMMVEAKKHVNFNERAEKLIKNV